MEKDVKFSDAGKVLVATLSGEIDHHLAKGQREAIDGMLFFKKPEVLVLDFREVRFMDSSGIGLIIGRAEVASGMGTVIQLSGLSPAQRKLIKLSGIERIKNVRIEDEKQGRNNGNEENNQ